MSIMDKGDSDYLTSHRHGYQNPQEVVLRYGGKITTMVGMDAKDQIIEQLRQLIERQQREIDELKLKLAKAMKDSSNSSKPPSSDIVKPPIKKKRVRGKQQKRKQGGQPGHKRQMREMLPPERVDEAFAWHNDIRPQFCWAHLIRDIRFLLTHSSKQATHWAKQLLKQTKRLFRSWHARDEMSKTTFDWAMRGHRNDFMKLMLKPPPLAEAKNLTARFSIVHYEDVDGNLQPYDQSENYFRFMSASDVLEPTNNHCEQQIRHCVIDRRITQGTRSDIGQRYNERMWSVVATCAKHAAASSTSSTSASSPTSRTSLAPLYSARKP